MTPKAINDPSRAKYQDPSLVDVITHPIDVLEGQVIKYGKPILDTLNTSTNPKVKKALTPLNNLMNLMKSDYGRYVIHQYPETVYPGISAAELGKMMDTTGEVDVTHVLGLNLGGNWRDPNTPITIKSEYRTSSEVFSGSEGSITYENKGQLKAALEGAIKYNNTSFIREALGAYFENYAMDGNDQELWNLANSNTYKDVGAKICRYINLVLDTKNEIEVENADISKAMGLTFRKKVDSNTSNVVGQLTKEMTAMGASPEELISIKKELTDLINKGEGNTALDKVKSYYQDVGKVIDPNTLLDDNAQYAIRANERFYRIIGEGNQITPELLSKTFDEDLKTLKNNSSLNPGDQILDDQGKVIGIADAKKISEAKQEYQDLSAEKARYERFTHSPTIGKAQFELKMNQAVRELAVGGPNAEAKFQEIMTKMFMSNSLIVPDALPGTSNGVNKNNIKEVTEQRLNNVARAVNVLNNMKEKGANENITSTVNTALNLIKMEEVEPFVNDYYKLFIPTMVNSEYIKEHVNNIMKGLDNGTYTTTDENGNIYFDKIKAKEGLWNAIVSGYDKVAENYKVALASSGNDPVVQQQLLYNMKQKIDQLKLATTDEEKLRLSSEINGDSKDQQEFIKKESGGITDNAYRYFQLENAKTDYDTAPPDQKQSISKKYGLSESEKYWVTSGAEGVDVNKTIDTKYGSYQYQEDGKLKYTSGNGNVMILPNTDYITRYENNLSSQGYMKNEDGTFSKPEVKTGAVNPNTGEPLAADQYLNSNGEVVTEIDSQVAQAHKWKDEEYTGLLNELAGWQGSTASPDFNQRWTNLVGPAAQQRIDELNNRINNTTIYTDKDIADAKLILDDPKATAEQKKAASEVRNYSPSEKAGMKDQVKNLERIASADPSKVTVREMTGIIEEAKALLNPAPQETVETIIPKDTTGDAGNSTATTDTTTDPNKTTEDSRTSGGAEVKVNAGNTTNSATNGIDPRTPNEKAAAANAAYGDTSILGNDNVNQVKSGTSDMSRIEAEREAQKTFGSFEPTADGTVSVMQATQNRKKYDESLLTPSQKDPTLSGSGSGQTYYDHTTGEPIKKKKKEEKINPAVIGEFQQVPNP